MIIDFHTHAFPDRIAEKAMNALEEGCQTKGFHDGRLQSLLDSMDQAGIEKSVICNIATKPDQFLPILNWSQEIAGSRIIPFASVHPDDPDMDKHIDMVADAGLKGIKMHPYYQKYILDEKRLFPIYQKIQEAGLIFVSHTGFDIAFPRQRVADPEKIINVINEFPDLKFITTHLGSWQDWDEVEKHLVGKPIYIEISFSLNLLNQQQAKRILTNHPAEYLLFGTDSPWTDQVQAVYLLKQLGLNQDLLEKIFFMNAQRLLK